MRVLLFLVCALVLSSCASTSQPNARAIADANCRRALRETPAETYDACRYNSTDESGDVDPTLRDAAIRSLYEPRRY